MMPFHIAQYSQLLKLYTASVRAVILILSSTISKMKAGDIDIFLRMSRSNVQKRHLASWLTIFQCIRWDFGRSPEDTCVYEGDLLPFRTLDCFPVTINP